MSASAPSRSRLSSIAARSPEFAPFLAVVAVALEEVPAWATLVHDGSLRVPTDPAPGAPLLDGAEIAVPEDAARALVARLLESAGKKAAARSPTLDARALIEAAIQQDEARVAEIAVALSMDPAALAPLAQLAAMPLLFACCRALTPRIGVGVEQGTCPLCGAFPALAEVRGLERRLCLRCSRCGGDFRLDPFTCPFCDLRDHLSRTVLVPEKGGEARKVEVCSGCQGYLKTVASLTAWPAEAVLLEDLDSVDLDLAAQGRGYLRPPDPGRRVYVKLTPSPAAPGKKRGIWGIFS